MSTQIDLVGRCGVLFFVFLFLLYTAVFCKGNVIDMFF